MNNKEIAKDYHHQFGFNVIATRYKTSLVGWRVWSEIDMNVSDIEKQNWDYNVNGLSVIMGNKLLRCLDFDKVNDEKIVEKFLIKMGLPIDYPWVVKSGSGIGFHIYFYCSNDMYLFKLLGGEKSSYVLKPKLPDLFDHLDLRWQKCLTVLPPSQHESGNTYRFHNINANIPETPPAEINIGQIIKALEEYCILDSKKNVGEYERNKTQNYNLSHLQAAAEILRNKINNYDEFFRIGIALASLGEDGRNIFLRIFKDNPNYPQDSIESLNHKFDGLIKDYSGKISLGTFYKIARKYGFKLPSKTFWKFSDQGKVIIDRTDYIEYLQSEGFSKLFIGGSYVFVKIDNRIVREVTPVMIKDHVISYINELSNFKTKKAIKENIIRNVNSLFSQASLECLRTVEPDFIQDSKRIAYVYYENVVLEISADCVKHLNYEELNGNIWEKQIIKRNFKKIENVSQFEKFIENISRNSKKRIEAMQSAIGYLIHGFKDPTRTKAIIFTDEKLSDSAYGRSGKGLVAKALEQMRVMTKIDGKNFKFDKSFAFQSVGLDTQLIFFDDVQKKFDFEKLFSIITEGMNVEKKNRDEITIPFERSPKILISTNFSIAGHDDSSKARQFVIEFSDFYNKKHTPIDDFEKMFFSEWDDEDWNAFDNYMVECCRFYLEHGLVEYDFVNLQKKKLIDATSLEFQEFTATIPIGVELNKKDLYQRFKNENEEYSSLTKYTFTKWLRIYADLYELNFKSRRPGGDCKIKFTKQEIEASN